MFRWQFKQRTNVPQARPQSSVTAGQKNIWGGTDQFYPHLWDGRPTKNRKKALHPGRLLFFVGNVSLGGHVHIAWQSTAESNGADLAFCL